MLDALSPQRRRLVLVTLALFVTTALVIVGAVALRPGDVEPLTTDDPGPVLLVAGYGGRTASLEPLATALRAAGRTAVVVPPVTGNTGDLRVEAENLAAVAEQARRDAGTASVDVVGYSAGGVIARLWVRDDGGGTVARRVITLASPHHGTSSAALGAGLAGGCSVACTQLIPGSDLLRRLNAGDETPDGPVWITVRTTADRVVTPVRSAALEGALNLTVQDFCPAARTAHGDLIRDPVVTATLRSGLGAGPPVAPSEVAC